MSERNLARENEVRRQMTKRKNKDKVIVGYIETRHPAIYAEANKYLEDLTVKHPDKKDLSKTKDFRQLLKTKKTNSFQHMVGNKVVEVDRFQLRIELSDYKKRSVPEVTTAQDATLPAEMATAQDATLPAEVATAQDATLPAEVTTAQDASLSLMDEESLNQIVADLRQDPTIAAFFNEFEYELDNCPLW